MYPSTFLCQLEAIADIFVILIYMHLLMLDSSRGGGRPKSNSAPMDTDVVNANCHPSPWRTYSVRDRSEKRKILHLEVQTAFSIIR